MADINIVRKPPIWPWVATAAALLLVVGLIVWAASQADEPQFAGRSAEPGAQGTSGAESPAIRDYLQFAGVIGNGEAPEPGREHEYTAEGLRKLAAALQVLEREQGGVGRADAAAEIRSRAEQIQREPASPRHANAVRDAFMLAAQAMPGDADLQQRAQAISAQQPLLEQTDAIRDFFKASGEAVQEAARNL